VGARLELPRQRSSYGATSRTLSNKDTNHQFLSFLFPALFAIPLFDILSSPFGTSLAANWMWL